MNSRQEFYTLWYKERESGLSTDEKKRRNDIIYQMAMEERSRTPQTYGLSLIGIAYEDILHYANCKQCNRNELADKVNRFKERMKEIVSIYSLTSDEIKAYFIRNHYPLSL